jgi:hypothetical protein
MPSHTAKSLFELNIKNCDHLLNLYDGIEKLAPSEENLWLLRAVVVFAASALDAYFHDKIKYRAGHYEATTLPDSLKKFKIELGGLAEWEKAHRKGNVLRNWVVNHYATRPLQKTEDIKDALKLVGIENVWGKAEPDPLKRDTMLKCLREITRRRNQIAHEGDRLAHRAGGKKVRPIDKPYAEQTVKFARDVVLKIEAVFPK